MGGRGSEMRRTPIATTSCLLAVNYTHIQTEKHRETLTQGDTHTQGTHSHSETARSVQRARESEGAKGKGKGSSRRGATLPKVEM